LTLTLILTFLEAKKTHRRTRIDLSAGAVVCRIEQITLSSAAGERGATFAFFAKGVTLLTVRWMNLVRPAWA